MANIHVERDGLADGMPRDERGYWKPDKEIGVPNPVFTWPPKPRAIAKWVKDYIWPMNLIYMIVATVTWMFLTPEMARMKEFSVGWIAEVFIRNQVMLIALATVLHVRLWSNKAQGYQYKWSPNWMGKSKKFLWNDQVRDNVFWSVASAGTIWTGFEVVMLWAYRKRHHPLRGSRAQQPVWFVVISGPRAALAGFPLLLGAPPAACEILLQDRASRASQRISTSVPGRACRCTRSSTCSITPAC